MLFSDCSQHGLGKDHTPGNRVLPSISEHVSSFIIRSLGGGLTTTTTLEKPRVANEPRDQIIVNTLYSETPEFQMPGVLP